MTLDRAFVEGGSISGEEVLGHPWDFQLEGTEMRGNQQSRPERSGRPLKQGENGEMTASPGLETRRGTSSLRGCRQGREQEGRGGPALDLATGRSLATQQGLSFCNYGNKCTMCVPF